MFARCSSLKKLAKFVRLLTKTGTKAAVSPASPPALATVPRRQPVTNSIATATPTNSFTNNAQRPKGHPERINSQALDLGIERPKLRNQRSIANQNTLIYVLINPYEGKPACTATRQATQGAVGASEGVVYRPSHFGYAGRSHRLKLDYIYRAVLCRNQGTNGDQQTGIQQLNPHPANRRKVDWLRQPAPFFGHNLQPSHGFPLPLTRLSATQCLR